MFRALLETGGDFLIIHHDSSRGSLHVSVDESKISTHGKPALEDLALRLHIYRCTADVEGCRLYFEKLTKVHATHLAWRDIVLANKPPSRIFVQPNTFLNEGKVTLKDYEPTIEGMIESWAERDV